MMTIDEMIEVLKAAKEGKTIESKSAAEFRWTKIDSPVWNFHANQYRIKPQPRVLYCPVYKDGRMGASYHSVELLKIYCNRDDIESIVKFVEVME